MTINTLSYTVGDNLPLNHARILWDFVPGAVTGDGDSPGLVLTDEPWQRWSTDTYPSELIFTADADDTFDMIAIANHNLHSAGASVSIGLSQTVDGAFVDYTTFTPPDNSAIAFLATVGAEGNPAPFRRMRFRLTAGSGTAVIGNIRMGVALQMQRPIFGGHTPIGLAQDVETTVSMSERGQPLGRSVLRVGSGTNYSWQHLSDDWVRSDYMPFREHAQTRPFFMVENPMRMPEGVAWCWAESVPAPTNMGIRNLMQASLTVRGLL